MVKYLVVEARTGKDLSQKLEELTREQSGVVQGFTYNPETRQYASMLCFPSEQSGVTVSPLTSGEIRLIDRNNVLVLREQGASRKDISDYLAISKEGVDALLGKANGKRKN